MFAKLKESMRKFSENLASIKEKYSPRFEHIKALQQAIFLADKNEKQDIDAAVKIFKRLEEINSVIEEIKSFNYQELYNSEILFAYLERLKTLLIYLPQVYGEFSEEAKNIYQACLENFKQVDLSELPEKIDVEQIAFGISKENIKVFNDLKAVKSHLFTSTETQVSAKQVNYVEGLNVVPVSVSEHSPVVAEYLTDAVSQNIAERNKNSLTDKHLIQGESFLIRKKMLPFLSALHEETPPRSFFARIFGLNKREEKLQILMNELEGKDVSENFFERIKDAIKPRFSLFGKTSEIKQLELLKNEIKNDIARYRLEKTDKVVKEENWKKEFAKRQKNNAQHYNQIIENNSEMIKECNASLKHAVGSFKQLLEEQIMEYKNVIVKTVQESRQEQFRDMLYPLLAKYGCESLINEKTVIDYPFLNFIPDKNFFSAEDKAILVKISQQLSELSQFEKELVYLTPAHIDLSEESFAMKQFNMAISELSDTQKENIQKQIDFLNALNKDEFKSTLTPEQLQTSLIDVTVGWDKFNQKGEIEKTVVELIDSFFIIQANRFKSPDVSREVEFMVRSNSQVQKARQYLFQEIYRDCSRRENNLEDEDGLQELLKSKEIYTKILGLSNQLVEINLHADYDKVSQEEVKKIAVILDNYKLLIKEAERPEIAWTVEGAMKDLFSSVEKYINDEHPVWAKAIKEFQENEKEAILSLPEDNENYSGGIHLQ